MAQRLASWGFSFKFREINFEEIKDRAYTSSSCTNAPKSPEMEIEYGELPTSEAAHRP